MSRLRLYIDEDAMQTGLVTALAARGVDVVTAADEGLINRADEEHLRHASSAGRVLYSYNVADYMAIHEDWLQRGSEHQGIILSVQQRYSIGEQLRRLLHIRNAISAEAMQNRLEFLSNW